jgi:signal transduction histidine kinase/CheY-like chemotaxis protein
VLWKSADARNRLIFLHATDIRLRTIKDQFGTYTVLLRGAAGLFAAQRDRVTLSDFRAYVQRSDIRRLTPGVLAVGFTRTLPAAEQGQLLAEVQALGVSGFRVHPNTDDPTISPVIFAEPPNPRNLAAIGYDVMSDPVRREMVERARDTGRSSASAPIQLVQEIDANKQAGFLVATPVYAGGAVPASRDERRRLFQGFVFGAFRADDLFRAIAAAETEDGTSFAVYDGLPGAKTLLHRSTPTTDATAGTPYRREAAVEVGGRTWTVVFTRHAASRWISAPSETWFMAGAGSLGTVLLGLASLRQARTQERVHRLNASLEARVDERTRDLQYANAELRRAGEERARVEEQFRQSQKMEAVGQLTGGLAHDFNNLLAGISGSLELMQTRMSQGRMGDLDRYMSVAQGAAKRAAALTHRLLAFSRRQTLDPKPTNVNRLITDMEELVRRTVGPHIHLEVVGLAGAWPALIDPGQLENALLNLCINARDAMPDGGRITIETANKWMDEAGARQHDLPPGQYLSVCVTDTGTGMSADLMTKVFEPFFTTKPLGEGTGLGLSMVYGFARQSGGQVRLYSEVGEGTTVCLYLPRHYGEAEEDDGTRGLSEVERASEGQTVLIVDDEPSVRMLVTEVLEDLGYTAIEAADSVAGLKVLQSDVRIDLLVTDVGLPGGMNGRQMADAGRERRPDLKVLFITGYAENAVLGNGYLRPGMQVLTKPFVLETLASRINELIRT